MCRFDSRHPLHARKTLQKNQIRRSKFYESMFSVLARAALGRTLPPRHLTRQFQKNAQLFIIATPALAKPHSHWPAPTAAAPVYRRAGSPIDPATDLTFASWRLPMRRTVRSRRDNRAQGGKVARVSTSSTRHRVRSDHPKKCPAGAHTRIEPVQPVPYQLNMDGVLVAGGDQ